MLLAAEVVQRLRDLPPPVAGQLVEEGGAGMTLGAFGKCSSRRRSKRCCERLSILSVRIRGFPSVSSLAWESASRLYGQPSARAGRGLTSCKLCAMVRVGPILFLILLSACSTAGDPGPSDGSSREGSKPRDLRVERVAAGAPGEGPARPRVILAPSAEALSGELGAKIRGSGGGTYLLVHRGERPTGGYSVAVAGARVEGDRVTVRLRLKDPPPDAMVTQSLTYPYEISVLRDLAPEGKSFSFVDGKGEKLDWPIRRVED